MTDRLVKNCQRYIRESAIGALAYLVLVFVSVRLGATTENRAALFLLAAAPMGALGFSCVSFFRYYANVDERERRILADSAAISLLIGLMGLVFIGALEKFELVSIKATWLGAILLLISSLVTAVLRRIR